LPYNSDEALLARLAKAEVHEKETRETLDDMEKVIAEDERREWDEEGLTAHQTRDPELLKVYASQSAKGTCH